MDRAAFLAAAAAAAPTQLQRVDLPGFPEPVYLRRMTVSEMRKLAEDVAAEKERGAAAMPDAVSVAVFARDETGALLFDRGDVASMTELQAVLDRADYGIVQVLMQAAGKLDEPKSGEVDEAGN